MHFCRKKGWEGCAGLPGFSKAGFAVDGYTAGDLGRLGEALGWGMVAMGFPYMVFNRKNIGGLRGCLSLVANIWGTGLLGIPWQYGGRTGILALKLKPLSSNPKPKSFIPQTPNPRPESSTLNHLKPSTLDSKP